MTTVEQRIEACNAVFVAFDLDFADKRIHALSVAFELGYDFRATDTASLEFIQALRRRGINTAKPGENPWLPMVRAVTCSINNKGEFVQNSSWDKYAGVLRFADNAGWTPAEFISKVRSWTNEKGKGGLVAMTYADRLASGKGPRKSRKWTDAELKGLAVQAKCKPAVDGAGLGGLVEGKFALARVYVENGQIYVWGVAADSQTAALKLEVAEPANDEGLTAEDRAALAEQVAAFKASRAKVAA